jgi:tRNA1Val (adenine37-N6)-methyltransferase
MSDIFRFKQFSIRHRDSAMKVGTDGVLLGAWVHIPEHTAVIHDVGSGTGLIGLMLAQRVPDAQVIGFELDAASAREGQENMALSPFADRCSMIPGRWQDAGDIELADLIISNPPFYHIHAGMPDGARKQARQETELGPETLFKLAYERSTEKASMAIVWPSDRLEEALQWSSTCGWTLWRQTLVKGRKSTNRVLLQWSKETRELEQNTMAIHEGNGHSPEHRELTKDFYL